MDFCFAGNRSEHSDEHREIKSEDTYTTGESFNAPIPSNFVSTSGPNTIIVSTANGLSPKLETTATGGPQHFSDEMVEWLRTRAQLRKARRKHARARKALQGQPPEQKKTRKQKKQDRNKKNTPGTKANAVPVKQKKLDKTMNNTPGTKANAVPVKQKTPNETKNNTPGTNANAVPVGSSNAINANKRRKLNIGGETAATPPTQLIEPMFAALSIQTNLSDHPNVDFRQHGNNASEIYVRGITDRSLSTELPI